MVEANDQGIFCAVQELLKDPVLRRSRRGLRPTQPVVDGKFGLGPGATGSKALFAEGRRDVLRRRRLGGKAASDPWPTPAGGDRRRNRRKRRLRPSPPPDARTTPAFCKTQPAGAGPSPPPSWRAWARVGTGGFASRKRGPARSPAFGVSRPGKAPPSQPPALRPRRGRGAGGRTEPQGPHGPAYQYIYVMKGLTQDLSPVAASCWRASTCSFPAGAPRSACLSLKHGGRAKKIDTAQDHAGIDNKGRRRGRELGPPGRVKSGHLLPGAAARFREGTVYSEGERLF